MGPDPAVAAVRLAVRRELADLRAARDAGAGASARLVLAACSGGADSVALAAALAWEAPRAGLRAGVVTVDHGLQAGSGEQAARVAALAATWGVAVVEAVRAEVGTQGGPEAAARDARYAALDEAAERLGAVAVLLGHTRDDQAETVLLGLARGAGARSLAGMPVRRGRYRRPLLDLPRTTTRAACSAAGVTPWEDPHNADPAYARARVRTQVLPVLEAALGPGVGTALARTARLLRADADALDVLADEALERCRTPPLPQPAPSCADGIEEKVALDVVALAALPLALRTRVLRSAALAAGAPAGRLTAAHVEALVALVGDWRGRGPVALPGGLVGIRGHGQRLAFGRGSRRSPGGTGTRDV